MSDDDQTSERDYAKLFKLLFRPLHALTVSWGAECEAYALKHGEALTADELSMAQQLGVSHPEEIRVIRVPDLPVPGRRLLHAAMSKVGLIGPGAMSLTFGHGIFLTPGISAVEFAHELCHVGQYERLGGIRNFLALYMAQLGKHGHDRAPMEVEARSRAQALIASLSGN